MPKELRISVTEYTVSTGKKETITFMLDDRRVSIPVDPQVKAYFKAQFVRDSPSGPQRQKFATIMNLLRAAYIQGRRDEANDD